MTTGGWIFLIMGWGVIISLTTYCFVKVMKSIKKTETN